MNQSEISKEFSGRELENFERFLYIRLVRVSV